MIFFEICKFFSKKLHFCVALLWRLLFLSLPLLSPVFAPFRAILTKVRRLGKFLLEMFECCYQNDKNYVLPKIYYDLTTLFFLFYVVNIAFVLYDNKRLRKNYYLCNTL